MVALLPVVQYVDAQLQVAGGAMQNRSLRHDVELGSIERELFIDAPPEIVFEVVSDPRHVAEWWADAATFQAVPGSTGTISFGTADHDGGKVVALTVVEAVRPRTFSFRWTQDADEAADVGNSLLVTFELVPSGTGTVLKFVETGFREMGWEAAMLEATYLDHVTGWKHFLPRLVSYATSLGNRP
jgi:uncharacterized protein YndB with AHSA1/START domain